MEPMSSLAQVSGFNEVSLRTQVSAVRWSVVCGQVESFNVLRRVGGT